MSVRKKLKEKEKLLNLSLLYEFFYEKVFHKTMPCPVDFDLVILEDIKLYFDFYAKIELTLQPRQHWVEIFFKTTV